MFERRILVGVTMKIREGEVGEERGIGQQVDWETPVQISASARDLIGQMG
jgi:hypothetical protein